MFEKVGDIDGLVRRLGRFADAVRQCVDEMAAAANPLAGRTTIRDCTDSLDGAGLIAWSQVAEENGESMSALGGEISLKALRSVSFPFFCQPISGNTKRLKYV